MKLKLKEEPREWLKFTAVMALASGIVAFLLLRRHVIDRATFIAVLSLLVLVLGIAAVRPRWFRGFYRAGMTASWHVGQVMGRVLLTAFFVCAVIPMGLLLRLLGKDLLKLRRDRSATSYWQSAGRERRFDRLF